MLKSRPLFLIVVTLCLLTAAVASYWVALLPQRTLRHLQAEMLAASGMTLDSKRARLDIANGFGVVLEDVSITNASGSPWQLTAKSMDTPGWLGGNIVVDQAVLDVDIANFKASRLGIPGRLTIRDGILKVRDPARQAVFAVTDINGTISSDGANGLHGELALVRDSQISDISFDIEDVERLATTGSPMDMTLKSKDMLFAFSGQGRADMGFQLAGQATTNAADVGGFFSWLGLPVQSLDNVGKLTLQGGLETKGLSANYNALSGDVGGVGVKGDVTLAAGADRARLSGNLALTALSLWGLNAKASLLAQPWSEAPLGISDVAAVDLDMATSVDQLKLRDRPVGAISAHLKSTAGQMTIVIPEQKLAGGSGNLNLSLVKAGDNLNLQAALVLTSTSAQTVLGGLLGFDFLNGAVDLNAALKASGQSVAGLISTLEGTMKLSSQSVAVERIDLTRAMETTQKGWSPPDTAKTDSLSFELSSSLLEGVASLRAGTLSFNSTTVKPKGEIDILRQAVLLQLSAKGKNIDTTIAMTGPWTTPEFKTVDALKEKKTATPPAN